MPLIKCPDCKKDISSFAEACPHCGYPLAKIKKQEEMRIRREEHLKHAPTPSCSNCSYYRKIQKWNNSIEIFEEYGYGCSIKDSGDDYIGGAPISGNPDYTYCSNYEWEDENYY